MRDPRRGHGVAAGCAVPAAQRGAPAARRSGRAAGRAAIAAALAAALQWPLAAGAAPASQPARPTLVSFDWGPGAAAETARELAAALAGRFRVRLRPEVVAALQAAPASLLAAERAAAAIEEGRGHETRLDWRGAEASYGRALELLDERLARVHSPEAVARVHLALGAVYFNDGRRALAIEEFRRAVGLWPRLQPDRGYSPQVREAFEGARRGTGPREARPAAPPPTPAELARLCAAVDADALVLIEDDEAAGRHVLRGSLFIAARGVYIAVETRALAGGAAPAGADVAALAARLLESLDTVFPPPRRAASQPATRPAPASQPVAPPPPPPPRPWWRTWWVWAVAGVVVAGVVALPIYFTRRDTVDLVLRY